MFVGHYAAALAAKGAEPRTPLWVYVGAAQLVDIGWASLSLAGVERFRIDETLPGSALVLEHMPWTHSLPAALIWALAGGLAARVLLRLPKAAAVMVGLVVFSHWLGDLLVHRPDLELWFGGPRLGLALWNQPVLEELVEVGMLGLGAAAWAWRRGRVGGSPWPPLGFTAGLLALQAYALAGGGGGDARGLAVTVLGVYLACTAVAWVIDRPKAHTT